MEDKYIKGLGILVGKYNEEDLKNGIDKKEVEEYKQKYNLNYTNTKIIKEKGVRKIAIYVCNVDDMKINF